jgi:hypothetical protein
MLIFLKLCLAHLIADFILQFDELFQLKLRSVLGHILHAFFHALVMLLLLFPYLGDPFIWCFITAVAVIHFYQDRLKYRYAGNKKHFFWIFVVDQAVHILFLSSILLFPASKVVLGFPALPALNPLYTDPFWTLCAVAFLTATFAGNFLFYAFSVSYYKNPRKDHFITTFEIVHGLMERTIISGIFLFSSSPSLMVVSLAAGAFRLPFKRLRGKSDFMLSAGYAVTVGLLFRLWVHWG